MSCISLFWIEIIIILLIAFLSIQQFVKAISVFLLGIIDSQYCRIEILINYTQTMQYCQKCMSKQRQFKIIEVQLRFEIKKLNQDMAQQKITLELSHQREIKKLTEKISQVKNERQLQNKSWMQKYDDITQHYQEQLRAKDKQHQDAMTSLKHQSDEKEKIQQEEINKNYQEELVTIQASNQDYLHKLLTTKEEQKKCLRKIHEDDIKSIKQNHQTQIQTFKNQEILLREEIRGFQHIIAQKQFRISELEEELIQSKATNLNIQDRVTSLENKIKYHYENEVIKRGKQIQNMKEEFQKTKRSLENNFSLEKDKIIKETNKKIEEILRREYQNCQQYERKLKNMDEQRAKQLAQFQENYENTKKIEEEKYIPKSHFHQQISTLKVRLSSKEKDIENAKQQIKKCRLEIQNNEQILNKFFKSPNLQTAPDLFTHTPQNKRKDYKIKKNRVSMSGVSFLEVGRNSNVTSMECLDKLKDFQSFRML